MRLSCTDISKDEKDEGRKEEVKEGRLKSVLGLELVGRGGISGRRKEGRKGLSLTTFIRMRKTKKKRSNRNNSKRRIRRKDKEGQGRLGGQMKG